MRGFMRMLLSSVHARREFLAAAEALDKFACTSCMAARTYVYHGQSPSGMSRLLHVYTSVLFASYWKPLNPSHLLMHECTKQGQTWRPNLSWPPCTCHKIAMIFTTYLQPHHAEPCCHPQSLLHWHLLPWQGAAQRRLDARTSRPHAGKYRHQDHAC